MALSCPPPLLPGLQCGFPDPRSRSIVYSTLDLPCRKYTSLYVPYYLSGLLQVRTWSGVASEAVHLFLHAHAPCHAHFISGFWIRTALVVSQSVSLSLVPRLPRNRNLANSSLSFFTHHLRLHLSSLLLLLLLLLSSSYPLATYTPSLLTVLRITIPRPRPRPRPRPLCI